MKLTAVERRNRDSLVERYGYALAQATDIVLTGRHGIDLDTPPPGSISPDEEAAAEAWVDALIAGDDASTAAEKAIEAVQAHPDRVERVAA
jgi:hypothetical protein